MNAGVDDPRLLKLVPCVIAEILGAVSREAVDGVVAEFRKGDVATEPEDNMSPVPR